MQHWHQFCRRCGARVAAAASPTGAPAPALAKPAPYVPPPEYSRVGSADASEPEPDLPVRPRVTVRIVDAATRAPLDGTQLMVRLRGQQLLANAEGTLFLLVEPGEPEALRGADFTVADPELEHLPWAFQLRARKEGLDYEATLVVSRADVRTKAQELEGAKARCPACEEPCFGWQRFCGACGALRDREAQRSEPPDIIRDGRSCARCDLPLVEGFRYCTGCGAYRAPRIRPR